MKKNTLNSTGLGVKDNSVEPTATPWRLERGKGGPGDGRPFLDIVGNRPGDPFGFGFVVTRFFTGEHRPEGLIIQDLENAKMIVRAVNSHDALVSALKSLVEWLDISGQTSTKDGGHGALAPNERTGRAQSH